MAVTLQQIAERAGVSRGTVDRALNNRSRISPEVAEKIKKIAKEMGYQPNRAGRALAMAKRAVKIGVIVQAAETPFMHEVMAGVKDVKTEVEQLGAEVIVKKIEGVNAERAVRIMEAMREKGCGGIALMPADDGLLRQTVNRYAEEYQIPIVTFNSDLKETKRICFVGQNTLQSGRTAAGLMAEMLRPKSAVQVISGYPENNSHKNRVEGFWTELKVLRPDIRILDIKYDYDDDWVAEKIVEEMIKKEPELAGIYLCASGVEGACKVLEKRELTGKIKVVCNDLTEKNREYLKQGTIQFLLGQNAYIQGYEPVMTLFRKLLDGVEPEEEYHYTEIVIKTRYN